MRTYATWRPSGDSCGSAGPESDVIVPMRSSMRDRAASESTRSASRAMVTRAPHRLGAPTPPDRHARTPHRRGVAHRRPGTARTVRVSVRGSGQRSFSVPARSGDAGRAQGLRPEDLAEVLTRVGCGNARDGLRRAFGDHLPPKVAAFGSQVNQPIRRLDD